MKALKTTVELSPAKLTRRLSKIVRQLFTNGSREQAHRLVMTDSAGQNLGGWNARAVADVIRRELEKK